MKRFPNILNESLLDDVEIDEVQDDDSADDNVVRYVFTFSFDTGKDAASVIKSMFFEVSLKPALERLKNSGYLESWTFVNRLGSLYDDPVIDLCAQSLEDIPAKKMFKDAKTLSLHIGFRNSVLNDNIMGCVCASLFNALMTSSRICTGSVCLCFRKENTDAGYTEIVYCVYYLVRESFNGKWIFYAGAMNGLTAPKVRGKLAGSFVRSACRMGILQAADDNRSRFIVFGFGLTSLDKTVFMFDSEGTEMFSDTVVLDSVAVGDRFMDNGLLYVYTGTGANYLRMDATLVSNEGYLHAADTFSEGYAWVRHMHGGKYNLIDKDGNELCEKDYGKTSNFVDGIAVVSNDRKKSNIIDKTGKPLLDDWYDAIEFGDEQGRAFAKVSRIVKGKRTENYIDRNGNLLMVDWITGNCMPMSNGFAKINYDDKTCNYLKEDGTMLFKKNAKEACGWPECGVVAVRKDKNWRFVNTETGKPLFGGEEYETVMYTIDKFDGKKYYTAIIGEDKFKQKRFVISAEGEKCTDIPYSRATYIGNGFISVSDGFSKPVSVIKWRKGIVIGNLTECGIFKNGYAKVSRMIKNEDLTYDLFYNYIDTNGNLFMVEWCALIGAKFLDSGYKVLGDMHEGFVAIMKKNVMTCKGVLLFGSEEKNVNRIFTVVPNKLAVIEIRADDMLLYNLFDADGRQLLDEWTAFRIFSDGPDLIRVGPCSYVDHSGKFTSVI